MTATANDLLKLYDRPTEPVFMPKGEDNSVFEIPSDYLEDRYKPLQSDISNRWGGGKKITVKKITLPDLSLPLMLGRRDNFSLFFPHHRRMAARLIEVFMGMRTLEDFISATVYCRDRVNPYMFIYALSVAIIHRPDTKHLDIPSIVEVFPEKYMDSEVFARAREEANIIPDGQRMPLEIPRDYTGSDLDVEHRVAYFREDLGINLCHWHWHLVYPFSGPRAIIDKDRRGELFYYFHQQVMARYNMERLCNNLARTKRLTNFRGEIAEGYFPKLDSLVSSRVWPPRFSNSKLSDIDREFDQVKFDLLDLERWRDRIFSAIHTGQVVDEDGKFVELSESRGINILGNMMEASMMSVNQALYGDLHNFGHVAIALCHDPEAKNLETFSVMGDSATAMRDPVFYRWHAMIDDIFQEHKNTLPRYTIQQLDYPGVKMTSVDVVSEGSNQPNRLNTFWQQSDIDMSRGLDFTPRGSVFVRFTHLQHRPFTYRIVVESTGAQKRGTVRIFIGPKFDERGLPMLFRDHKNLFIELDKFVINLKPGKNNVERKSTQSSVTIPFERTFRDLQSNRPADGTNLQQFNFCGCGWPHHMLLARGSAEGYPCQLFVMVSNYADDMVEQKNSDNRNCADAASYCGIRDSLYPDRRSMGFPFDRQPRNRVDTLAQFLTPNMATKDVTIIHSNTVRPRTQQQKQG